MTTKPDYKASVLDLLKKHVGEDVSRDSILKQTQISKSRLSEVLQSIKSDGYTIITPPRSGIVRLEVDVSSEILPPIKDSDIRQWIILFLLSKHEKLTFNELLLKTIALRDYSLEHMNILIDTDETSRHYDNTHLIKNLRKNVSDILDEDIDVAKEIISVTALRKDLAELRNLKLVALEKGKHTSYRLTSSAPYIIPLSGDSLYEFCQRYEESASSTKDLEPLKKAYAKITNLINLEGSDSEQHRFGRINDITPAQIDTFNSFILSDYKSNLIQFTSGAEDDRKTNIFAVGLLFYSVETSCFYALGDNITTGHTESRRLDRIYDLSTLCEPNTKYHNSKYYKIFDEMFSSSYEDEAQKVKVLFQDAFNVKKRFWDLCQTRKNSSIHAIDNPPEGCIYTHVYEDTLRGIPDFARFLRGFGMSALALEPTELKEKMIFTYNRIIEKYEEIDGDQN